MQEIKNVAIMIPSLNADEKLEKTVCELEKVGFSDIIIINDGSAPEYDKFYPQKEAHPFCTLIKHEVNKGKGAGIKTGLKFLLENRPDCIGVITVDADGQHLATDVYKCAKALIEEKNKVILGVRDFSLPDVPPRSKAGNRITSFVFKLFCQMKISDTQTGLRAIPAEFFESFIEIEGDRYEYETNMLLEMRRQSIDFAEVGIETVYIEENKTSHFHPVRDSIRIYKRILAFFLNSIICTVVDKLLLWALFAFVFTSGSILLPKAISRIVSSVLNLAINKKLVFKCKEKILPTVLRYFALAVPQLLVETLIDKGIVTLFSITSGLGKTLIDLVVCTVIFFLSYKIQKNWVFKNRKK